MFLEFWALEMVGLNNIQIGDIIMERIEHKVGEIFEYEEEKIITVEVEESLCYK